MNRRRTVFLSCHRGSDTLQIEGHTGRHDNRTLTRHKKHTHATSCFSFILATYQISSLSLFTVEDFSLTLAAVRSIIPEPWCTLTAVWPVDPRLAGAAAIFRVARLQQRRRGVAVAAVAAGTGVKTVGAILEDSSFTHTHTHRRRRSWLSLLVLPSLRQAHQVKVKSDRGVTHLAAVAAHPSDSGLAVTLAGVRVT